MAFAFLLTSWEPEVWHEAMQRTAPDLDVRMWPELGNPADITHAAAWLPPPDALRGLPNLKVIFSLGAGVDAILKDTTLPADIPIVRVNEPDLTMRMSEYVVFHVLMHHRQQRRIDANQKLGKWDPFATRPASELAVGIMGLGVMGTDSAIHLRNLGFKVAGWSRTRKHIDGVHCYAGPAEFDSFLHRTDILVCLLPHTPETTGILNRALFRKLSSRGPLGGPVLINAGRGKQQVEADILAALDAGELLAATLDVFETEPLPPDSALWHHPKVTVTPHIAADSDPDVICAYVYRQMQRHMAGQPLENLVNRALGY